MENGRIFQQLIPEIVENYSDLLVSVILYGTVARGTQTDESDIDMAVILRSKESDDMKEVIGVIGNDSIKEKCYGLIRKNARR